MATKRRKPAGKKASRRPRAAKTPRARARIEIDAPAEPEKRRYRLQGPQEPPSRDESLLRFSEDASKLRVQVKASFRPASRAAISAPPVSVDPDDVIEIEFADGIRAWLGADEFLQRFAPRASREGAGSDVIQVPESLDVLPAPLRSRGPVSWAIKALRVLGIDLAGMAMNEIAKLAADRPSLRRPGLGLHKCTLKTGEKEIVSRVTKVEKPPGDEPILIFIHGTFSSTWASFGDLWSAERADQLSVLRRAYGDRVYGFEHETLLKTPVANAIALAEALPKKARVHLVSQSRGGLVGELLCRSGRTSARASSARAGGNGARSRAIEPFGPAELEDLGDDALAGEVRALDAVLREKQLSVERFVRVACPALGTTLASGRLDRMLSVIGTAAGLLRTGPFAEAFTDFGGFLAAIVKKRTSATELPGIEAMMPESRLIRLVNWPETEVSGDLIVVSGDLDPQSLLAKGLVWALDRFYESGHDLVVNTPSMYGGATRGDVAGGAPGSPPPLRALLSEHSGAGVNHFAYFRNRDSAAAIVRGLVREPGDSAGFEPLRRSAEPIAREVVRGSAVGPRPVVFVLPGIMGSELHAANDRVWMDVGRIVFGGFERLRLGNPGIKPKGILRSHYGELVDYLAETYKVVAFPFDWRLSINDAADALAVEIKKELNILPPDKPLRILAHSMGGLVARTMLAREVTLRRDLHARDGFRFIMCGTPNGGSHIIPQLLVGELSVLRMLSIADLHHGREDLLEIISRFPGVLAMLPLDQREDYFDPATWGRYSQRAGKGWVAPAPADLRNARRFRDFLDNAELDPEKSIYVAGCADATVSRMYVEEEDGRARIRFMATTQGDGTVMWSSGIPPQVPTWYMRAKHGDLLRHEDSFRGLLELLETGRTAVLSRTPPVARGVADEFPLPREADVVYPDDEALASAVLGSAARPSKRARKKVRPVTVGVLHGDLRFAQNAVMVGHYAGDTIVSAERALDAKLGGELTRRNQIGVYPRDIESCIAFVERKDNPRGGFEGAIVVGLGTAGVLNTSTLTRTLTRGLIEYALECAMIHRRDHAKCDEKPPCEIGVSPLLIGTNAGGVGVADSVYAVLRAVIAANAALSSAEALRSAIGRPKQGAPEIPTWITRVEFIELWEDRAILAMQALRSLTTDDRTADHQLARAFDPELQIRVRKGSRRRTVFEEPPGWWHRVQIRGENSADGTPQRMLRFTSTTRRARSEVRVLPTQMSQVDAFVREAIRTTRDDRAVARTLFELLLPNELKDEAPNTDNIVLHLDEISAGYPWELLEDPFGEQKEPFVLQHGVLRQLEVRDPPALGPAMTANNALVIGDPMGPFVELKGAQEEAKDVARALEAGGYTVAAHYDRPSSATVLNALYEKPYRILHLAGHGVYRWLPSGATTCEECNQPLSAEERVEREKSYQPLTGMVLGENAFLTPVEVQQMRRVPELVFINCCHLGRIAPGVDSNRRDDYHRLAASLASEFIRIGVRAVIAAGWAVDDREALIFATTFYNHMLRGGRLGESVKAARRAAYDDNPSVNTWGAYQCYGDPDYVLPTSSSGGAVDERRASYSSAAEMRAEIDNLRAQLSLRASGGGDWHSGELDRIVAWREKAMKERGADGDWLRDGSIAIALARAFGEAELFDRAVKHYQDAIDHYPQVVSQEDVEQLVNLTCRATVAAAKAGKAGAGELTARLDRAVEYIAWLQKAPSARGGGSDADRKVRTRWETLLGSAAKRRAWIAPTKAARPAALKEMSKHYQEAVRTSTGPADTEAALNFIAAGLIESWFAQPRRAVSKGGKTLGAIDEVRQFLRDQQRLQKDFWVDAPLCDCDLLEALAKNGLDDKEIRRIADAYQQARSLGSPREFASVTDQIEFLQEMATVAGRADIAKGMGVLLEALRREPD